MALDMNYFIASQDNDITYMAELIPMLTIDKLMSTSGLNRTITYSHLRVRKLCAY